jgi:hypothetical protein
MGKTNPKNILIFHKFSKHYLQNYRVFVIFAKKIKIKKICLQLLKTN